MLTSKYIQLPHCSVCINPVCLLSLHLLRDSSNVSHRRGVRLKLQKALIFLTISQISKNKLEHKLRPLCTLW